ncbi:MAG TPA: ABC transporter substrate-binding protein [Cyclobacteriaceae bacterium]|nr:ABC transporter substrate-binding protein [Cyclobacteriaceae bacterium]
MKREVGIFLGLLMSFSAAFGQQRIITAGSAITETVCALGDCDKIVASDKTSTFPESIQNLPSIGYRNGIHAEGIISLKPTLIIAEKDYVKDEVLAQLSSSGIRILIINRKLNVNDTKKFIAQIAAALNRQAEGKKLIASIDADIAKANALLKKTTSKPKVLAIYNRGTSTMSLAGKETFSEILNYAGAENVFTSVEGYKPLNTEALIAANPDYLLTTAYGLESLGGVEGFLKIPGVAQTTAGKKKQIVSIDSLILTNFGPRIGKAIKELVVLIHPELSTLK